MIILPELRYWRRERDYYCGYVYKDPNAVWLDGDFTDFTLTDSPRSYIVDCGLYFIAYLAATPIFKLPKDEEIR